jgi:hypothetical protein
VSSREIKASWSEWAGSIPPEHCLLRTLIEEAPRQRQCLTRVSLTELRRCLDEGLTIRSGWPRPWSGVLDRSIGRRLFLTHTANAGVPTTLVSLACSALGHGRQQLAAWPQLIDSGLRRIQLHQQTLLVVPGTTVGDDSLAFAQRAKLSSLCVEVSNGPPRQTPQQGCRQPDWVEKWLQHGLANRKNQLRGKLLISPPIDWDAVHERQALPLQDRIALLLSDIVLALHVRPAGTVDRLLHERLDAVEYPPGSTYCAIRPSNPTQGKISPPSHALMDHGAIGWYVLRRRARLDRDRSTPCRQSPPAVCQLTIASRLWRQAAESSTSESSTAWNWLTHCTRAVAGPRPGESHQQFRDRLWLAGEQVPSTPFQNLMAIITEGRLKAASQLYRGGRACISFTAVPLPELLLRRVYRSHLGRWDWEPYGLLVRREVMQALGCRSVVYGGESDYQSMTEIDKPFFQARGGGNLDAEGDRGRRSGKPSSGSPLDWTQEHEWRLLQDLKLWELPRGSWMAFTRTRSEAEQLSRIAPCPVCWTQQEPPG